MATSPISMLLGGFGALLLGLLFKYRALPFLKPDLIPHSGAEVPTADLASFGSILFFSFGSACLLGAVVWMAARTFKKRRSNHSV